jgi:large subunit ribosomal protein L9
MAQKILLLQDVEHVGRKGEIASVKPGFAYNFLIPQGFALVANRAALRHQAKLQEERRLQAEHDRSEALEIAGKLDGETVETTAKVDHEGHMYGSVTVLDIITLVKLKTGIELDRKHIPLKHPFKEVGVFDVSLRLKEGATALIHVKIVPEETT